MLKKLSKSHFDKYIGWAYGLALDKSKSSYPTYADGFKTEAEFIETAKRSFERSDEGILLFSDRYGVCGWINYYFIPQDGYISFHTFLTERNTEDALREFEKYCAENFDGELYMGFPEENVRALRFLQSNGYFLLEHSRPFVYEFEPNAPYNYDDSSQQVVEIGADNYELFRKLHAPTEQDMYWTSDRILADLNNWRIFYYDDGNTSAALYMMINGTAEIFGIDYADADGYSEKAFSSLLSAAIAACRSMKIHLLWYFTEEVYEHRTLEKTGFTRLSEYSCYTKVIEKVRK